VGDGRLIYDGEYRHDYHFILMQGLSFFDMIISEKEYISIANFIFSSVLFDIL
jgi:hypothetical protein